MKRPKAIQRKFIEFNDIDGASYASYEFPGFSSYAFVDKFSEKDAKKIWIIFLEIISIFTVVGVTVSFIIKHNNKKRNKRT